MTTYCPSPKIETEQEICYGGEKIDREWHLHEPKGIVGFPIAPGQLRRMTLSLTTPTTLTPQDTPVVQIFQRNDHKMITGSVSLELKVTKTGTSDAKHTKLKAKRR
jgi:hypothetical protein